MIKQLQSSFFCFIIKLTGFTVQMLKLVFSLQFFKRKDLSFTYKLLKCVLQKKFFSLQTAIFTIVLLPFRVAAICGLLIIAWWLASIGLYGLSEQELRTKPMTGWRKYVEIIFENLMCLKKYFYSLFVTSLNVDFLQLRCGGRR